MTARLTVLAVVGALGAFAAAYVLAGNGSSSDDSTPARAVKSVSFPVVTIAPAFGAPASIPHLAPAPAQRPASGGAAGSGSTGTTGTGTGTGTSSGGGGGGGGGVIEG